MSEISVENGKYTFRLVEGDYGVHVLRGGEPWVVIEAGCKAVIALMFEIEERERAERHRLLDAIEAARSEFELRNVIAKERAK